MVDFEIMQIPRKQIVFSLWLAGMCFWGAVIYSNTLHAPFVFDDIQFIIKNPTIRNITDGTLWNRVGYRQRFVAFLSFAFNYHLHGTTVAGYHWVNLAIHLANSLLVVWLVLLLFGTVRIQKDKTFEHRYAVALSSGWLFMSHPIQTQAVSYITQRFESLAALFYLLSVCLYLKGRMTARGSPKNLGLLVLSAFSAFLGMFTKETVFTLPFSLILIEWLFFRPERAGAGKTRWVYVGIFFLLCTLAAPALLFNFSKTLSKYDLIGITSRRYLFTQFQVIIKYIQLLFLPLNQNVDYNLHLSSGLLDIPTLASLASLLFILYVGFRLCRSYPLIGFGILWFFVTLSVTSSIIPLPDMIFEHRLYIPSVGFVIACCAGLFSFTNVKNIRGLVLCLACVVLVFSYLTYQRNVLWSDDVALWQDAVSKSPGNPRAYNNLGEAYRKKGNYQKAIYNYLMALRVNPGNPAITAQIYANLGASFGNRGNNYGDYQKAIDYGLKAIKLNPKNSMTYNNLEYAYISIGDYEQALKYGKKAVKLDPQFDEALNNLGAAYGDMGQYEKATEFFERALKANPNYEEARNNLIRARSLIQKKSTSI